MINSPDDGDGTDYQHNAPPLCVHLRSQRLWRGVTQKSLAQQTGLPLARLRHLETCRELTLADWQGDHLDRLAEALGIPITALIARPATQHTHWVLAACQRAGILSLAVVAPGRLIEVKRLDLRPRRCRPHRASIVAKATSSLKRDYNIKQIVVESGTLTHCSSNTEFISLAEVKSLLMPLEDHPTHQKLLAHILSVYPTLTTLTREKTQGRPWSTIALLGTALGLAFHKRKAHAAQTAPLPRPSPASCLSDAKPD